MSAPAQQRAAIRDDGSRGSAEQRLKVLGIVLPTPPAPFGSYVEAVQSGSLVFLSGMLPTEGQSAKFVGRVGTELLRPVSDDRPQLAAPSVEQWG